LKFHYRQNERTAAVLGAGSQASVLARRVGVRDGQVASWLGRGNRAVLRGSAGAASRRLQARGPAQRAARVLGAGDGVSRCSAGSLVRALEREERRREVRGGRRENREREWQRRLGKEEQGHAARGKWAPSGP
jgi:hypothetical protein